MKVSQNICVGMTRRLIISQLISADLENLSTAFKVNYEDMYSGLYLRLNLLHGHIFYSTNSDFFKIFYRSLIAFNVSK